MYCQFCGEQLIDGSKFCTSCGMPQEDVDSVESAQNEGATKAASATEVAQPLQAPPAASAGGAAQVNQVGQPPQASQAVSAGGAAQVGHAGQWVASQTAQTPTPSPNYGGSQYAQGQYANGGFQSTQWGSGAYSHTNTLTSDAASASKAPGPNKVLIAMAALLGALAIAFFGAWRFGWFGSVEDASTSQEASQTTANGGNVSSEPQGTAAKPIESPPEPVKQESSVPDSTTMREQEIQRNPFVATSAECSSYLVSSEWASNYYGPDNVLNTNFDSVWCEGVSSTGVGEWVSLRADRPLWTRGIRLVNGHPTSDSIYYRNCRCKDITVQLSDGFEVSTQLKDLYGEWQTIDFGDYHETNYIRVRIDSVYEGMDKDTSIAAIAPL